MKDLLTTWLDYLSFATGSGNETVATHVSPSIVINRGAGGTLPHKVVSGKALSGVLERKFQDIDYEARITTAFTSGGAGTLRVQLITADNDALSSNPVSLEDTGVLAMAALTEGALLWRGTTRGVALKRYLGVQWIIATAAMTAGVIWAGPMLPPFQKNPPAIV